MYLYNKITVHIPDILKIFQCHKETNGTFTCSSHQYLSIQFTTLHSIHDSAEADSRGGGGGGGGRASGASPYPTQKKSSEKVGVH